MALQRRSAHGSVASAWRRSDPPPREEGPRYRRGGRQANVRWRAGCFRSKRPAPPAEPFVDATQDIEIRCQECEGQQPLDSGFSQAARGHQPSLGTGSFLESHTCAAGDQEGIVTRAGWVGGSV